MTAYDFFVRLGVALFVVHVVLAGRASLRVARSDGRIDWGRFFLLFYYQGVARLDDWSHPGISRADYEQSRRFTKAPILLAILCLVVGFVTANI